MDREMSEEELRIEAEEIVEAKQAFKSHLSIYLAVNAFIFIIWLIVALVKGGGSWFPWFIFPLGGWGIGIFFHAWDVYGHARFGSRREALVQKEMEKIKAETSELQEKKSPPD